MTRAKNQPPFIPPDVIPSFSPSDLCMLQGVVEEAWTELQDGEGSATPEREQITREFLAHRVLAHAARGQLNPKELKQHAVHGMARSRRHQKRPPNPSKRIPLLRPHPPGLFLCLAGTDRLPSRLKG
jgi:hypothetical protein